MKNEEFKYLPSTSQTKYLIEKIEDTFDLTLFLVEPINYVTHYIFYCFQSETISILDILCNSFSVYNIKFK